jgi:acetolactate synthase-1/2/3 large subunit
MTGAMYIAACLKREGVTKVFGQCGHTNYALIDACQKHGIEYVSFRHEQLAAHAADAYYRVSHKLAVLNVHLSPGLTNTLTGVATAAADSTPMLVFSGNTPSYHHVREAHQSIRLHADASQAEIFRPIAKRTWRIDDAKLLVDLMPRALNLALSGRPGVVVVDVPMDVFSQQVEGCTNTLSRRPNYPRAAGAADGVAAAIALLLEARSPVIFAGNGILLSEACNELREFVELSGIAIATTLMGKGIFPEDHALSLGMTGIWGSRAANETTREADVILAIGTAFGEADCSSWDQKSTFVIPKTRLIQVDLQAEEIGKSYPVEIGIVGDAKATLKELTAALRASSRKITTIAPEKLAQRKQAWEDELAGTQTDTNKPIHPARLLKALVRTLPADAIVVTDVGWNKNGAGQQLKTLRPASFITSGGMATMGFSPGAAVGAALGAPDRKVVCLVGDGGLLSALPALATAVELATPVLFVVFNNFCYSTIWSVGTTYFKNAYGTEFRGPDGKPYNPDFPKLAESFGIESAIVYEPEEIEAALVKGLKVNAPYLLEVRTRGDIPMPRTGYWDIADFLQRGND